MRIHWSLFSSLSRLREFFGEHLCILNSSLQVECAKLLIRIAAASKMVPTSNTCLHYAHQICNSAHLHQETWNEIAALLTNEDKKEMRYALGIFGTRKYLVLIEYLI